VVPRRAPGESGVVTGGLRRTRHRRRVVELSGPVGLAHVYSPRRQGDVRNVRHDWRDDQMGGASRLGSAQPAAAGSLAVTSGAVGLRPRRSPDMGSAGGCGAAEPHRSTTHGSRLAASPKACRWPPSTPRTTRTSWTTTGSVSSASTVVLDRPAIPHLGQTSCTRTNATSRPGQEPLRVLRDRPGRDELPDRRGQGSELSWRVGDWFGSLRPRHSVHLAVQFMHDAAEGRSRGERE
jgi:hypothetical protein